MMKLSGERGIRGSFEAKERLKERREKESVKRICIKSFSCNYHSCIAVTENNQIFVWGRRMQNISLVSKEEENDHGVLNKPKHTNTLELPVKVDY